MTISDDSSSSSCKPRQSMLLLQQQQQLQQSTTTTTSTPPPPSSGNNNARRAAHRPRRLKSSGGIIMTGASSSSSSPSTIATSSTSSTTTANNDSQPTHKESGSLLWTLLLVGLFFCLIDISYMVVFLERKHHTVVSVSSVPTPTITDASNNLHNRQNNMYNNNNNNNNNNNGIDVKRNLKVQEPPVVTTDPPGPPKSRAELEQERGPILQVLKEAGIGDDIDDETLRLLPTWAEFTTLYGVKPHVYGLHNCGVFQNRSDPADHFVSTAGNFNTGTNLMAELLISNCHMQKRMDKYGEENRGIRWQVPWGKHTPPGDEEYRQTHKTANDIDVDPNNIMPAVTIRDPYVWLKSMCRHPYGVEWPTTEEHCPNLVPNQYDLELYPFLRTMKSIPVFARYLDFDRNHDSLIHNWNDWYNEYMNVKFPFIMVRYEDLLFRPKEMTEMVCECAGGTLNGHFEYIVHSAKRGPGAHGHVRTSYVDALIQYGSPKRRLEGLQPEDLEFAHEHLDRRLMQVFGYPDPPQFAAAEQEQQQQEQQQQGEVGKATSVQ